MALLHGKQIAGTSVSLGKLDGTGIVTFTAATMSFAAGTVLTTEDVNIVNGTDVVNKNYVDASVDNIVFDDPKFVDGNTIDFVVNAGDSVTAEVILNGTASGLTSSVSGLSVNVDGVTIIVNSNGELEATTQGSGGGGKAWTLQFFNNTDAIQVEATPDNIATFTSGFGVDVGTIEVSTDGVTYTPISFPFAPTVGTWYFKRSTALVTGSYTISE